MQKINIYEMDKVIKNNQDVIIHISLKNEIIGEFSMCLIDKVLQKTNLTGYHLQVESFNLETVLPAILLYRKGKLVNKLIGFHNFQKTLNFVKKSYEDKEVEEHFICVK